MIHYNGEHMTDVTDDVHPECAALAVLAARVVGLDIAGIDMIVPDISRPFREQGGMIVEVNAGPGLRMHLEPPFGKPRPVAEAILNTLFDEGQTGRVPIVAVTGARRDGRQPACRWRARGGVRARRSGIGRRSDCRRQRAGSRTRGRGPAGRAVLLHPDVEMAVLETPFPIVLREGLAFDRCDVAVVTGIGEDRSPEAGDIGSPTAEVVTMAHRLLVEVVAPQTGTAVLNAGRPNVAAMVECCRGQVIFFAETADEPVLVAHLKQGCRGVFVRGGEMILAQGAEETAIATLDRILRRAGVGER